MPFADALQQIARRSAARPLTREQARDLFGQMLDGAVGELEVGAFCVAMRLKGESVDELCGFLDATHARLNRVPAGTRPLVVLPSYNGARRRPVLTPLLALLLARRGLPVLVHGTPTESRRVAAASVLQELGVRPLASIRAIDAGEAACVATSVLHPGLDRLLQARQRTGLRNSSHSIVKLMNPCAGDAIVVASYTHPEFGTAMGEVFARLGATALLLRGTEGEAVADARRLPAIEAYRRGQHVHLEDRQQGTLAAPPDLPREVDPEATAAFTRDVLAGRRPVPAAIATQVEHIVRLAAS